MRKRGMDDCVINKTRLTEVTLRRSVGMKAKAKVLDVSMEGVGSMDAKTLTIIGKLMARLSCGRPRDLAGLMRARTKLNGMIEKGEVTAEGILDLISGSVTIDDLLWDSVVGNERLAEDFATEYINVLGPVLTEESTTYVVETDKNLMWFATGLYNSGVDWYCDGKFESAIGQASLAHVLCFAAAINRKHRDSIDDVMKVDEAFREVSDFKVELFAKVLNHWITSHDRRSSKSPAPSTQPAVAATA